MIRKYILFDLDGTLTDPMVGITKSVQYALKKFGIEVEDHKTLTAFIGPPLRDSFCDYYGFSKEQATMAIEYYREYYKPTGIFENELYEGIDQMLAQLKKHGYVIALATSKPEVFAEKILEYFNIKQYFDCIAGSDLAETRVKKDEVIRYALNELAVEKEAEVTMVGDRCYDVKGAYQCKIHSVAVTYGYGSVEELKAASPNVIVDSVEALKQYFLGIND
ncbi:MAG: HAD family hydrolase [Clostridiales bacterium]|nr:HAD family hydrolase [Clostridiales bacterium]